MKIKILILSAFVTLFIAAMDLQKVFASSTVSQEVAVELVSEPGNAGEELVSDATHLFKEVVALQLPQKSVVPSREPIFVSYFTQEIFRPPIAA